MFCCAPIGYRKLLYGPPGTSSRVPPRRCRTSGLVLIHAMPPQNSKEYLPGILEYKPQAQLEDAIDDPSSVFFDPNEKPGFVYKAIATYAFQYDDNADLEDNGIEATPRSDSEPSYNSRKNEDEESPNSSVFDDSLDMISFPNSPSHPTDDSFERNFNSQSRRSSLELDPLGTGEYHTSAQTKGPSSSVNSRPELKKENVRLFTSPGNSSVMDKFNDIHLYDDEIFNEARMQNRAYYASDAESVKTYQDSGIYEDENVESPKPMTAEDIQRATHQIIFGGRDESEKEDPLERYSVFKTPSGSRQNSLEREKVNLSPTNRTTERASTTTNNNKED